MPGVNAGVSYPANDLHDRRDRHRNPVNHVSVDLDRAGSLWAQALIAEMRCNRRYLVASHSRVCPRLCKATGTHWHGKRNPR